MKLWKPVFQARVQPVGGDLAREADWIAGKSCRWPWRGPVFDAGRSED